MMTYDEAKAYVLANTDLTLKEDKDEAVLWMFAYYEADCMRDIFRTKDIALSLLDGLPKIDKAWIEAELQRWEEEGESVTDQLDLRIHRLKHG